MTTICGKFRNSIYVYSVRASYTHNLSLASSRLLSRSALLLAMLFLAVSLLAVSLIDFFAEGKPLQDDATRVTRTKRITGKKENDGRAIHREEEP